MGGIRPIRRNFLAAAAILTMAALGGPAAARINFDGNWSVAIWTDSGNCDRGYRYEMQVASGTVKYRGEGSFDISGQVDAGGGVKVRVARGEQWANGTGQLAASQGRGTWRGQSATGACAGWWEAERR